MSHDELRKLCNFQYWLGSNYTTLTTSSDEMTERAIKYVHEKNKTRRYKCLYCGRYKFVRKSPHNCNGKYRRKNFAFVEI